MQVLELDAQLGKPPQQPGDAGVLGLGVEGVDQRMAAVGLRRQPQLARELARLASDVGARYADLVYNGLWYSITREAIDALVAKVQQRVTGAIRLKLYKGGHHVVGRKSPFGLYDEDRLTQSADSRPANVEG